ncbi:hypothetical protein Micbo1qcDRAFT_229693 [Microdochium bolleyi]|uniref:DUF974 domain-containing protein n=1 Tax=Microdochium bolleyi TaxID=196109 RepID=A0A136JIC4_9PEZI|nr:hypothetical protein Micbo1qcDRAFT_229693 [Microdochium bolleyi]
MSHQRYPSIDPVKEPHGVSLKVLRLSRPSLVSQHPLLAPSAAAAPLASSSIPASLAYQTAADTNPDPFLLTPVLNLPPSFGSAYVGETFSCTLCANNETHGDDGGAAVANQQHKQKRLIRDVRIEAEMKTPGSGTAQQLTLTPSGGSSAKLAGGSADDSKQEGGSASSAGVDLEPGQTLQKIVNFDLKDEGNHVLAVTVSYYEATETSGRTRTFRKLYQFICKGALIVRTKVGVLPAPGDKAATHGEGETTSQSEGGSQSTSSSKLSQRSRRRRWVMEAQLENCSEDAMQLSRVALELDSGVHYRDCNWEASGSPRPLLQPGEIQQCCFIVGEDEEGSAVEGADGRIVFGVLGIGWRSEMGSKGYLTTGKLGTRAAAAR